MMKNRAPVQSSQRPPLPAGRGFTLIELVVVVALIGVIGSIAAAYGMRTILMVQTKGFAADASALLRQAKLEAVRQGRPAQINITISADQKTGSLFSFVDENRDGLFNPADDDAALRRIILPPALDFRGPDSDPDPVVGFTGNTIVFNPDGSLREAGAFRFAVDRCQSPPCLDSESNLMEILVGPSLAVGKITVRKFTPLPPPGSGYAWLQEYEAFGGNINQPRKAWSWK